ncbi:MAG TPA: 1-deoxy-D-xylulose-5-phosphate reductoisomerase [Candidatus Hydrogenedentes bacterium]|nr:1-deoxy-D-xylulose-5-phosphate reductoisomerase [Candidatus Hydrogenedentota bacterium]
MSDELPRKKIVVLGATGSIGRSALEVVRRHPDLFEVTAIAAHTNVNLIAEQIAEFHPRYAAMGDKTAAARLAERCPETTVYAGPEGLETVASLPVDVVLCAMVGAAGLRPMFAAIDAGNRVAVSNKEPVVMAGKLIMERAAAGNADVIPVDSEHNAVFQCLHGHRREDVRCIHLTASGGPFYGKPRETLARVTPEEATRHPTWDMGDKVSVDSATLMNKGLEIIEAMWLFGLPQDRIEVLIHPQSIVHGLVEFNDGSILAQMSVTDMKLPILTALMWPDRVASPLKRLDLTAVGALQFAAPDFEQFPCLAHARRAAAEGGTAPAILNAANEVGVQAFCNHRISFLDISEIVRITRDLCEAVYEYSLEDVLAADCLAREKAAQIVDRLERNHR